MFAAVIVPSTMAIIVGTFERLFKQRDESRLNAAAPGVGKAQTPR
jgi:hypothetical protein